MPGHDPATCQVCVNYDAAMASLRARAEEIQIAAEPGLQDATEEEEKEEEEEEPEERCDWCATPQPGVETMGEYELCFDCRRDARECDHCGGIDSIDAVNEYYLNDLGAYRMICEGCRDDLQYCEDCDQLYSGNTNMYETTYGWECQNCHNDNQSSALINGWNYRPNPILIDAVGALQPATYYMGLELETDHVEIRDVAESVVSLTSNLYLKEDGSLNSGVEIVSHPGSLEAWQNGDVIPWEGWQRDCTPNFRDMDEVESAGIHVHVSRTAFERKGKWSASHLWKFMQLHYRNERAYQRLSGRFGSSYAGWSQLIDRQETTEKAKPARGSDGDRYRVINVNNDATVECRYFQANERKEIILSDIELVHASVEYTRLLPAKAVRLGLLDFKYFRAWCLQRKETYPNLCALIKELPGLVEENRFLQAKTEKKIKAEQKAERERVAITREIYRMMNVPPPTNPNGRGRYMGVNCRSPESLRESIADDRNNGWWHGAVRYEGTDRISCVEFLLRDLVGIYLQANAGIDVYEWNHSGRAMEARTAMAWHMWDMVEAIRDQTNNLIRDIDMPRLHAFINRYAERY